MAYLPITAPNIIIQFIAEFIVRIGRIWPGIATFDSTATAHAVVKYWVSDAQCRALFATHYHTLVDEWEMDPRVSLGHVDCFFLCKMIMTLMMRLEIYA